MSFRVRLFVALASSVAVLTAVAAPASAAAPFKLSSDGKPLVLTIIGQQAWNGQLLNEACIDSSPAITITAQPNASTAPTIGGHLQATWLPSNTLMLPGFAGAPFDVAQGASITVNPAHVFDWESGGGGLMQSVPVGTGPGRGTLWLTAYRYQRFGSLSIQMFSNVITVHTTVRNGSEPDCPWDNQILLPTGKTA